jgi:hypothetical protein
MVISYQYIAGLFDGEGCVSLDLDKRRGYIQHRLRIAMVHSDVLAAIAVQEDGRLSSLKSGVTCLSFYGKAAIAVAEKILPFSFVKKQELEIMLKAAAKPHLERQEERAQLKELKKKNSLCQ